MRYWQEENTVLPVGVESSLAIAGISFEFSLALLVSVSFDSHLSDFYEHMQEVLEVDCTVFLFKLFL